MPAEKEFWKTSIISTTWQATLPYTAGLRIGVCTDMNTTLPVLGDTHIKEPDWLWFWHNRNETKQFISLLHTRPLRLQKSTIWTRIFTSILTQK